MRGGGPRIIPVAFAARAWASTSLRSQASKLERACPGPRRPPAGAQAPPICPLPAARCSNIVQGSREQKAALDLLLAPENAGKARPHLVAACAFALG